MLGAPSLARRKSQLVFLTGTTAYIGCKIVSQLVSSSAIKMVFVLRVAAVRQKGIFTSSQRHQGRMKIWPGDLQQTRLGLPSSHRKTLSRDVDIIIHNGAVVRWNANYETLKNDNVIPTMEILQSLVTSSVAKCFYIFGGQQSLGGGN